MIPFSLFFQQRRPKQSTLPCHALSLITRPRLCPAPPTPRAHLTCGASGTDHTCCSVLPCCFSDAVRTLKYALGVSQRLVVSREFRNQVRFCLWASLLLAHGGWLVWLTAPVCVPSVACAW